MEEKDEDILTRDLYSELRDMGNSQEQCDAILAWTERLPIIITGLSGVKVKIMDGYVFVTSSLID